MHTRRYDSVWVDLYEIFLSPILSVKAGDDDKAIKGGVAAAALGDYGQSFLSVRFSVDDMNMRGKYS